MNLTLLIPRHHSDSELANKISFYKWLFGIGVLEITTSIALFRYFKVENDVLIFFYVLGFMGLLVCMWNAFQTVAAMSTTRLYGHSLKEQNKFRKT
jgi:hypothetical protein